jgi:hypothetical protein
MTERHNDRKTERLKDIKTERQKDKKTKPTLIGAFAVGDQVSD